MQNNYTQALECLDKAIILKPALYGAYSSKAKVLEKLGRFDEAINTYKASMVINSNDPLSYYNLGNLYFFDLQCIEDAIFNYEKAFELKPDFPYLLGTLLNAYMNVCRRTNYETMSTKLLQLIESKNKASNIFSLLELVDSLQVLQKAAVICKEDRYPLDQS